MSLSAKVHLWWTWLQIAVQNAAAAQNARILGVVPRAFESADSAKLSAEFRYALTTIAAVSFAMEALSKELEGAGHELDVTRFTKPSKTNRGFYVGHRIIQAFSLTDAEAIDVPRQMELMFALRNDGVHFESAWRSGVHPHPSGTHTAYELTVYTLERSIEAVQLSLDIVRKCTSSASAAKHNKAANDTANEMASVLTMLEETIEAEGLSGLK